jgi:hypothetical protein
MLAAINAARLLKGVPDKLRFKTKEPSHIPNNMGCPCNSKTAKAKPAGGKIAVAYPGGMASNKPAGPNRT